MNQNSAVSILNRLPARVVKVCCCAYCGKFLVKPDTYFCCPEGHGKLKSNLQMLLELEHEIELCRRQRHRAAGGSCFPEPSAIIRALEVFRENSQV